MTFALILMIKNESRILQRCLEAVENVVDYFCILDTGSTDNSVEIANEFLKTHKGCVTTDAFKDFGYSRTKSFENAQKYLRNEGLDLTKIYGLLLDADMVFIPGSLKQQTLNAIGYKIIQLNGGLEYYNCRIVRMDYPWKCVGVTHEYWAGPTENMEKNICYIDDKNDGGCKQDKFQRDIKLLEEGLEKEPKNERYMFYLAQTFKCVGRFKDAISMYKKRIAIGGWAEEIWHSHYSIGECYLKLKDLPKFEEWMLKAFAYRPCRTESIYQLARVFREMSQHYKSYHYVKIGQQVPFPKNDSLFIESNVYNGLFDYECSIVEYYIHREKCLRTTIQYMLKLSNFQQNCISNLQFSVKPIRSTMQKLGLPLPFGDDFNPSAISIVDYPFANVRYVNYLPPTKGSYVTRDGSPIQTKNAYVNLESMEYIRMIDIQPLFHSPVKGLEDLRLYKYDNKLLFTATSFKEFIENKVGIVHGEYDLQNNTYKNCIGIHSPTNSDCEKNWVNIPGTDEFIYGWNPLQIGKIRNNRFYVNKQYNVPPLFSVFRGSAPAMKWEDDWLVLIHFVEYCQPRKYYHCFVRLAENYEPLSVSLPFCFRSNAIEYCVSTLNINDMFIDCYISLNDTDPHKCRIAYKDLEWIEITKKQIKNIIPKSINKSETTYVSALIDLKEQRPSGQSLNDYLKHFQNLANTNLPFHVFISSSYEESFKEKYSSYKNISYDILNLEDLEIYKELQDVEYGRPAVIVENTKQTNNYNIFNNSKIEFVKRAIDKNIFNTNQYAWIDLGIDYIIKDKNTYTFLLETKLKENGIVIPTIWGRSKQRADDFNHINWRFCGGFFLGDKDSLLHFYSLYRTNFKNIITEKKVLPCEASIWSYFEEFLGWSVNAYSSDHNDTMLRIPKKYIKESSTTFVTALINPNEVRPDRKSSEKYFGHFKKLADTGISLHVFLSECYLEHFNELYGKNPNIYVETVTFEELFAYKELEGLEYELPNVRCPVKDTKNYMIIINSKVEFIKNAITKNIFKNNQFVWIDFGIAHIVQNTNTFSKLRTLENKHKGIYIASMLPPNNQEDFNNVNWRFGGGVCIGDKESLLEFCNLSMKEYRKTVEQKKILTWEVNFWQYLEYKFNLKLNTYRAGFNDSMILNI